MATVELKQIRKSYGPTEIIKGVDLLIKDRELTVFVGPSGCGKSTLLRMIAGLEEITTGDLLIDGKRVNEIAPHKRGLALVFQSYALYPHMTVAENMGFSLKLAKVPPEERARKILAAARILHLEPYLERKPKDLSGGQRQRVAIGRAIVRNPKVFLFDEPLSNLDAALRVKMRLELTKLHAELNATMIYVTHDQIEAMTMADRIVVLQGGVVEQVGAPMDLYTNPRNLFVAGFIGSPRMNFISVVSQQADSSGLTLNIRGGATLSLGDSRWSTVAERKITTLGIRPEHIKIGVGDGVPAQVQIVERLGGESYVHLETTAEDNVVVRCDGETNVKIGETVHLTFNPALLHFFDEHGDSILHTSDLPLSADPAFLQNGY